MNYNYDKSKKRDQHKIDTKQVVKEGKGDVIENKIMSKEISNNQRKMELPISQAKEKKKATQWFYSPKTPIGGTC